MRKPRRRRRTTDNPRNTDETAQHLRDFAVALREVASSLEKTAEDMDLAGITTLNVRCGKGALEYLETKIQPFAQDARRKLRSLGV
jgi:hypothetical protein